MSSRSGAIQTLKMRLAGSGTFVTVATPGDNSGFGGMNMNIEPSTFENKSGGLTTVQNAGTAQISGDFSVAENEVTLPLFLGQNGQRFDFDWENQGASADGQMWEAVVTVSRSMESRGKRMFNITWTSDGAVTTG